MADLWMPDVRHDPGRSAGYPAGQVRMQWFKHHDTAGTNSYEVCRWGRPGYNAGLCTFLLPKVGVPWQFCEFDALCYDSGGWNAWGPSMEVERFPDEELSDDQALWIGKIIKFAAEWGIPDKQYRGQQFAAEGFTGHVNHRDIAYNPDGISPAEWARATTPAPTLQEDDDTMVYKTSDNGKDQWYRDAGGILVKIDPLLAIAFGAFDPKKVVDLGGPLGALSYSTATVDARKNLGV